MKIYLEKKLRYNGMNVGPGKADIDETTAQDWIKRGWAKSFSKESSDNSSSEETPLEKMTVTELLKKTTSMMLEVGEESEYKGKGGKKKLLALIQEANDGKDSNSGTENDSENSGASNDNENSGTEGQE